MCTLFSSKSNPSSIFRLPHCSKSMPWRWRRLMLWSVQLGTVNLIGYGQHVSIGALKYTPQIPPLVCFRHSFREINFSLLQNPTLYDMHLCQYRFPCMSFVSDCTTWQWWKYYVHSSAKFPIHLSVVLCSQMEQGIGYWFHNEKSQCIVLLLSRCSQLRPSLPCLLIISTSSGSQPVYHSSEMQCVPFSIMRMGNSQTWIHWSTSVFPGSRHCKARKVTTGRA